MSWAIMKMPMQPIIMYLLCPNLSTISPTIGLEKAATKYVTTNALPEVTGVKQNLSTNNLLAPSINGMYNPTANIQSNTSSQKVHVNFLISFSLIYSF